MSFPAVTIWKKAPFSRLLIPFSAGIIIQWYLQFSLLLWQLTFVISIILFISFFLLPFFKRYKFSTWNGLSATTVFIAAGAMLVWLNDIRHNGQWFGNGYKNENGLLVTLSENLVEKHKSFKAEASVNYILPKGQAEAADGRIILYFSKDSSLPILNYGSKIIIKKKLQPIKSTGNPGSFDYKRYCLFQQLTHQVYLKPGEFAVLNEKNEQWLTLFIYGVRQKVLDIIQTYIPGEREKGLAEALLIGYKDGLDKTLVQSYTHTGVVHIIAISGLHLGLIYWLLVLLSKPLQRRKNTKWLKPVVVITGLWLFSLLAGAQPSVLRSAVMFTCIVLGESLGKKSSVYNSLAASAFLLLCYNPFWLWDAGFQLSYAAVLSIVIFMQPVYNWFYIKNKLLDLIWKMNAVTLAAQILTIPLSIYHFHQFPNYFLLTNFVAVPLSSLIVLGEIFLCAISFISPAAFLTGKILQGLIWLMNTFIERVESLPFSLWDGMQIGIAQAILLIITVTAISFWLLNKQTKGLVAALSALLCFVLLRTVSFIKVQNQQKIIIYNIPQRQALDFLDGRNFFFVGDTTLVNDDFAVSFHVKPARILNRTSETAAAPFIHGGHGYFIYADKHILLLDKTIFFARPEKKDTIDLLIFSKNPDVYIAQLAEKFVISQVVFDSSVPSR
ncbi:MAG: ComEC family competence protein, partial [Chitinophagaceae bacterium]|nr:ComEC family competence protein [Chitinophagaceae bacterium]